MATLVQSLKEFRSSVTDWGFRAMLEYLIAKVPANATQMTKDQAALMFLSTTDWGGVTQAEITHLDLLYKKISMTPSCNQYMQALLKHLREGGGTWSFKRFTIRRKELLKLDNGTVWGIRGSLYLGFWKQCDTLERPLTGPNRCVAPGTYTMRLRSKFSSVATDGIAKTSKPYTRIQIPDAQSERGGIQIHWGKNISYSEGCTLVGKYEGNRWQGEQSEPIYKDLLKSITGTDKAYKPASAAEWSLIPRVKLVVTIFGNPS